MILYFILAIIHLFFFASIPIKKYTYFRLEEYKTTNQIKTIGYTETILLISIVFTLIGCFTSSSIFYLLFILLFFATPSLIKNNQYLYKHLALTSLLLLAILHYFI